jgi:hypothetical protein
MSLLRRRGLERCTRMPLESLPRLLADEMNQTLYEVGGSAANSGPRGVAIPIPESSFHSLNTLAWVPFSRIHFSLVGLELVP